MNHVTDLHATDLRPVLAHEDTFGTLLDGLRRALRAGWRLLPAATRRLPPLAIAAVIAIVGLLLTFHQVVQGAVSRAEMRRAAAVQHAQAQRQCQALPEAARRSACLLALNATSAAMRTGTPQ